MNACAQTQTLLLLLKAVKNSLSAVPVSPWRRLQLGRGAEPPPLPRRERPPFSAASQPPCPKGEEDSCPTPFCIREAEEVKNNE